MQYDLDEVIDRTHTNSLKWEGMQYLDPDCPEGTLPLWVADMDFPCPRPVIEALHARVDRRIFGYSFHRTEAFMAAVTGWYRNRFGWDIPPEDVFYSPGIVPALGFLIELLTRPEEGIIIQSPVYYPFERMIRQYGRRTVVSRLIEHNGYYTMDFEDLTRKISDRSVKLLILCSPHNPVGRVWKEEELRTLGELCIKNDVKIVSDEIHCDLVRRGVRHTPLATLFPKSAGTIVTCTAPSKTFNLAGMQFSNVIIQDEPLKGAWRALVDRKLEVSSPTALTITAVQAAYSGGEEWLEQVIDYIDANLATIADFIDLHLPKASYRIPEGTYLAWIDLRAYGDEKEITRRLVREGKVLLEGGSLFGSGGEGYVRLNAACPRTILLEALDRISRVLKVKD